MNIFDNDHEVLQIGNLTIENGTQSLLITGDVELTKTTMGKEQARVLYEFAQALMAKFDAMDDLSSEPPKYKEPIVVDNPFE